MKKTINKNKTNKSMIPNIRRKVRKNKKMRENKKMRKKRIIKKKRKKRRESQE